MFSLEKDIERYDGLLDQAVRGFQSLMVVHGAGLAGCLTLVKDYATTPAYKGLGILIAIFSVGFLASLYGYLCAFGARVEFAKFLGADIGKRPKRSQWPMTVASIALGISLIAITLALAIIMRQFSLL